MGGDGERGSAESTPLARIVRSAGDGYEDAVQPEYACALIVDPRGWLVLQLRPADARPASGLLTCFGGRCETGEDDRACLERELDEELGWRPAALARACELWQGPRFIARFYETTATLPMRAVEPGHVAIAVPLASLGGLPLSPWHGSLIGAWRSGIARVDLAV